MIGANLVSFAPNRNLDSHGYPWYHMQVNFKKHNTQGKPLPERIK